MTKQILYTDSGLVPGFGSIRERLAANRTYFVRALLGSVTLSIASPAVASLTAHGLSLNDPVIFSILQNKATCTITEANPGVITRTAHGFAAGRPVKFSSSGYLPHNIVPGTTYYVIATGLTSNSFQISATVGGAAINTTAMTNTFVNGNSTITSSATHNLKVGQIIRYAGTSVVNIANATDYYVLSVPTGSTYTISATNGGTAITPGAVTTQGTFVANGTQYVATAGSLPTGVTEGQIYYVISAGLTANAFEFSATVGGAAINTSGSVTGSPVYSLTTGNDANDGSAATRSGAWLSIQKASDVVSTLDQGGIYSVTVQLADCTYGSDTTDITLRSIIGSPDSGTILQGNTTFPSNVRLSSDNGYSFFYPSGWKFDGIKMESFTNTIFFSGGGNTVVGRVELGNCGGYTAFEWADGNLNFNDAALISGASYGQFGFGLFSINGQGNVAIGGNTVTLTDVPSLTVFATLADLSLLYTPSMTFVGSGTGLRYTLLGNSVVDSFAGGANKLPGNAAGTNDGSGVYR